MALSLGFSDSARLLGPDSRGLEMPLPTGQRGEIAALPLALPVSISMAKSAEVVAIGVAAWAAALSLSDQNRALTTMSRELGRLEKWTPGQIQQAYVYLQREVPALFGRSHGDLPGFPKELMSGLREHLRKGGAVFEVQTRHWGECKELLKKAGLKLLEGPVQKGKHLRCLVETPDGRRRHCTFPLSPSDHRWAANALTVLKRLAKGDLW